MDDELAGLGQVLGQQGPPHVTAQGVLQRKAEEKFLRGSALITELHRQGSIPLMHHTKSVYITGGVNAQNEKYFCNRHLSLCPGPSYRWTPGRGAESHGAPRHTGKDLRGRAGHQPPCVSPDREHSLSELQLPALEDEDTDATLVRTQ